MYHKIDVSSEPCAAFKPNITPKKSAVKRRKLTPLFADQEDDPDSRPVDDEHEDEDGIYLASQPSQPSVYFLSFGVDSDLDRSRSI